MGLEDGGTIENKIYGTGWRACKLCGITDAEVKDDRCSNTERCNRVRDKLPLGPPLNIGPMVRYDLDQAEQDLVIEAVKRWNAEVMEEEPLSETIATEISMVLLDGPPPILLTEEITVTTRRYHNFNPDIVGGSCIICGDDYLTARTTWCKGK